MKTKLKQSGISLIETTIVVAIVATLAVVSVPVVRTFTESLGSAGSVKAMISTSLSAARALAVKKQKYAGIRFQEDSQGNQYMIFIINNPELVDADAVLRNYKETYGFCAVEGIKPIKLPENMGVMQFVDQDVDIDNSDKLTEKTTFSIVFSPSGKLVFHKTPVLRKSDRSDSLVLLNMNSRMGTKAF